MNKAFTVILLSAALLPAGCVERQIHITSEPAGALVYVSDVEVGRTPLELPFTWYGDYDIILRRDGYQTVTTHAQISPPWYEVPPLDLFSELAPWTYRDERFLHYEMEELVLPPEQQLIDRAERMREITNQPVTR